MTDIRKLYETNFQSDWYAKEFISSEEFECQWFVEDFYHRLFSQGKIQGKTLIDVGCGPTNRAAVVASRYGCEVYCADVSESTLNFLKNWLENGNEAFDFTPQFKHIAQLEGTNDIKYIEERVKKSIKEVIYCDVLADNPLHPRPFEQFDIVTSSMCTHCYPDDESYLKATKGIASLICSGGHLAFVNGLSSSNYNVADVTFPVATVDGVKVRRMLTEAGLKVLEVCEYYLRAKSPRKNDGIGYLSVYAIKD